MTMCQGILRGCKCPSCEATREDGERRIKAMLENVSGPIIVPIGEDPVDVADAKGYLDE